MRWFYEAVVCLRQLLSEDGSIYVHIDFNVGHYAKVIADEEFGSNSFRNEIVWRRTSAHANVSQRYGNVHDVLLYYTKSDKFTWNQQHTTYDEEYLSTFFDQKDERGRRYARRDLTAWQGILCPICGQRRP
jgi:adenine-specific DNA-methyltransferase